MLSSFNMQKHLYITLGPNEDKNPEIFVTIHQKRPEHTEAHNT